MTTYSFTYINQHGNGNVTDVKDFESDQEAIKHGRELLDLSIQDMVPQPHSSGFQDPCMVIDKWKSGYSEGKDPVATACIIAEYDDGTYNEDCTETGYHCEIRIQEFENK